MTTQTSGQGISAETTTTTTTARGGIEVINACEAELSDVTIDMQRLREIEWRASAAYASLGYPVSDWLVKSSDELSLAMAAGRLWVALDRAQGASIIGFALVEHSGIFTHLEELDVAPEAQRRGAGACLLEAVIKDAYSRAAMHASEHERVGAGVHVNGAADPRDPVAFVTLRAFRTAPWAMGLYLKLGFAEMPLSEESDDMRRKIEAEKAAGFRLEDRVTLVKRLTAGGGR